MKLQPKTAMGIVKEFHSRTWGGIILAKTGVAVYTISDMLYIYRENMILQNYQMTKTAQFSSNPHKIQGDNSLNPH